MTSSVIGVGTERVFGAAGAVLSVAVVCGPVTASPATSTSARVHSVVHEGTGTIAAARLGVGGALLSHARV